MDANIIWLRNMYKPMPLIILSDSVYFYSLQPTHKRAEGPMRNPARPKV